MKNLKTPAKILSILMMVFVLVSCKKNDAGLNDNTKANEVSAADLADYYVVSERKTGDRKLSLLSFEKEGENTRANLNGRGFLRSKVVTTTNSKLVFDMDDNGSFVYTFQFEKDASGAIKLKSYEYSGGTGLNYALLVKKTDRVAFENSTFKVDNLIYKIDGNSIGWDYQNRKTGTVIIGGQPVPVFAIAPEFTQPIYSLSGLGFKSNNDQFLGIGVPNWKAKTTPVMLIEKDGVVLESVKN